MKLSLAARRQFYDELGKLLAAGFPFSQAVETMLSTRPREASRQVLEKFKTLALAEANITECFSAPGLPFSPMEIALVSACERSGQLQRGCEFLERYYARLDAVRRQILRKSIYPVFMLHFGILILAIPALFRGGDLPSVVRTIVLQLGTFYFILGSVLVGTRTLVKMAVRSSALDRALGLLPLFGGIRRSLAVSRFCTTYQMQLDAAVNVMDSLGAAAGASGSALVSDGIHRALPGIRAGNAVGPEIAATGVLPQDVVRALVIGEKTGTLDRELLRVANDYEARALAGIETIGEWVPKLIYFTIVIFLAWGIVSAAKTSTDQLNQIIDSNL